MNTSVSRTESTNVRIFGQDDSWFWMLSWCWKSPGMLFFMMYCFSLLVVLWLGKWVGLGLVVWYERGVCTSLGRRVTRIYRRE